MNVIDPILLAKAVECGDGYGFFFAEFACDVTKVALV
jgi:hypothetical protein